MLTAAAPEPWVFGRLRTIQPGGDVCVLSYGPIMKTALALAARFEASGRSVCVKSVHTLKPLDRSGIEAALKDYEQVVVLEECAPNGGLGMQVKAIAWECGAKCRLDTFALTDAFIHCYGSHDELLAEHGLSIDIVAGGLGLS
ncbi:hypothetical protein WCLP8_2290009 [uncultured Gammaproteobacteria bacterium]